MTKRLFADIETSLCEGRFWRPGYKVNLSYENVTRDASIVCICWKWEGQTRVYGSTWDWSEEDWNDKPVLEAFFGAMTTADELVAHNGDRFDWPWIRTRCLYHGIILPEIKTVDTLAIARRLFKFPNNRMDTIRKYLGGSGKIHTSFDLWNKVCNGEKKSLAYMLKYCKEDVRELERMWKDMEPYFRPKTHAGVTMGRERWTCPHCGSQIVHKNNKRASAAGIIRHQMQCLNCFKFYTIADNVHRMYLEFRADEKARKERDESKTTE